MHQHIRVTVEAVIFGYNSRDGLSVLLMKRTIPPYIFKWALPGGFAHNDEPLEDCVKRELRSETGIQINYLEQLYTFGAPDRDPRGRVLSVAYFGLVRPTALSTQPRPVITSSFLNKTSDDREARWCKLNELPQLAFDHNQIIEKALARLRNKIRYEPIGFELLDNKFPISELEKLYELLLSRPIDRRNFQKKLNSLGILIAHEEKQKAALQGRPAKLFSFNEQEYSKLREEGVSFEI